MADLKEKKRDQKLVQQSVVQMAAWMVAKKEGNLVVQREFQRAAMLD